MDLLTGFVSIVGLLCDWKGMTDARESQTLDQYVDWLRRKEHQQLVNLILQNEQVSRSLRTLIEDRHDNVMARLEELNRVLSDVARHLEGFEPLADALGVQAILSDQAVSILRQMNEAGATKFIEIQRRAGPQYCFLGVNGMLQIDEPRFVESDLDTLVKLGFLLPGYNANGDGLFTITRAGAALGK